MAPRRSGHPLPQRARGNNSSGIAHQGGNTIPPQQPQTSLSHNHRKVNFENWTVLMNVNGANGDIYKRGT